MIAQRRGRRRRFDAARSRAQRSEHRSARRRDLLAVAGARRAGASLRWTRSVPIGAIYELRKKAVFALSQQRRRTGAPGAASRRAGREDARGHPRRGDLLARQGRVADLEFFKALLQDARSSDLREPNLDGVGQGRTPEASAWLLDIARDKSFDTETRKNAIFWAAQRRSCRSGPALTRSTTSRAATNDVQKQVLFIYSQRRERGGRRQADGDREERSEHRDEKAGAVLARPEERSARPAVHSRLDQQMSRRTRSRSARARSLRRTGARARSRSRIA